MSDFFPKYPLTPNTECSDRACRERQKFYTQNPTQHRLKKYKEEVKEVNEISHGDNEWGITLNDDNNEVT
jgi:ubiquitin-like modifier-activating enzyme 5